MLVPTTSYIACGSFSESFKVSQSKLLPDNSVATNQIVTRRQQTVGRVAGSHLVGGFYPQHDGDGEQGEDEQADRSNQDARHDARRHAVRRVHLGR